MNNLNINKIIASLKEFLHLLSKHRVLIVIIVSSVSIIASLMQTRTYLNPARNEELYTELSAGTSYSGIDEEIVEKLRTTNSDKDIEVNADLVPDRSNPFNE